MLNKRLERRIVNDNLRIGFYTVAFCLFCVRTPQCVRSATIYRGGAREASEFADVHGDFDLILGADVVFWPAAVPLLFETVQCFLSRQVSVASLPAESRCFVVFLKNFFLNCAPKRLYGYAACVAETKLLLW